MKLLFCANCGDVFNIRPDVIRECYCGTVRGKYNPDGHTAITNGKGYCLGFNNNDLRKAITDYGWVQYPEDHDYEWCRENLKVETWIRFPDGPSNPRSEIDSDL